MYIYNVFPAQGACLNLVLSYLMMHSETLEYQFYSGSYLKMIYYQNNPIFFTLETFFHIQITLQDIYHLRHTFSCQKDSYDPKLKKISPLLISFYYFSYSTLCFFFTFILGSEIY